MSKSLEDRCRICPELFADGYGRCDHQRCMECLRREKMRKALAPILFKIVKLPEFQL